MEQVGSKESPAAPGNCTSQNSSPPNVDSTFRLLPPLASPKAFMEIPPNQTSNLGNDTTIKTEAKDYWNGGRQHRDIALPQNGVESTKDDSQRKSPTSPDGWQLNNESHVNSPMEQESPASNARRNVQFATRHSPQLAASPSPGGHSRHSSLEGPETPGKSRGTSLMSKIKALANTPTTPTNKSPPAPFPEIGQHAIANSPTMASRLGTRLPLTLLEEQSDAEADADVDETADEAAMPRDIASKKRKKRRMRRFQKSNASRPSASTRIAGDTDTWGTYNQFLRRRASMPDTSLKPENHDHVMSEGDTRETLKHRPFRRGHSFMGTSTLSHGDGSNDIEDSAVTTRRASHLRRITVFGGGGVSDGDGVTPRRPFFNSERASNFGAQKWKQVKSTLKLLRQRKEDRFDYLKSAELMAELRAGAPAVLMLASMIQRDEHGNKRIPVLLEQLKLKVKDSSPVPDDDKDRHWIFTIELEYGSGPSRMNWTVIRTVKEIYNLHFRYRFALNNDKYMLGRDLGARPKQPKFPYSAFPYLRRARHNGDVSDDDDQGSIKDNETAGEGTGAEDQPDGLAGGPDGPHQPNRKRSMANLWGMRRRSTGFTDPGELSNAEGPSTPVLDMATRRQRYVEKQRRMLEKYLSEMIRWLMFRADSNRLCRFLELSALGVRLAAEGSYHGKEGYLHIQSSKGLDFRRVLTPAKVIDRHSRKWYVVRQSYMACVPSPESMDIYDVYLVDSKFSLKSKKNPLKSIRSRDKKKEIDLTADAPSHKHHTLTLHTSERKVTLFSRYQSVLKQFEDSINEMLRQTAWYGKKRFDSFAPVRTGVFAQWLVDGRDYMWNVSRAINMAKDVIYIHDWWLSPELYMRRPAAISQKWRLDRLLQKKAREGIKIFVIIYRNVEAAIPIDSEYTKFSLLNLHQNIFVQRSPNQFKKNQFFFAHHEKICIVDHDVAFLGGIDLCFGRWDCPQHPIVDDKPTGFEQTGQPKDAEHCQLFPGKDYSNPRVQDFFRLSEPYEEMYDRSKVPRMPWHDVGLQLVGQPARDLTRHFVQRWNYLRRGRKPTRPLPFLLPPPDAKFDELKALGLTGTCEVQILRSASTWSLGIEETEHSIQNAYIKMIEDSEHFVYVENQFFISSTEAYNTKIVNRIGDALVERIIRAHENNEDWRCAIMIPLMPGFQNTVDEQEGTSVRLILMCQYKSICRGEQSIFGRLRAVGIEPEDYIGFFCLRQWGVMSNDALVTEQLYIHAKTIIVDDRVALIGSANINERSMLGSRDSECAALVRDSDMISSTMAGRPYQVGRFAHSLRLRLMREHLGLDVDEMAEEERLEAVNLEAFEEEMDGIYREDMVDPIAGSSRGHRDSSLNSPRRSFNQNHDRKDGKGTNASQDGSLSSHSSFSASSSDSEAGSKRGKKSAAPGLSSKRKKKQQLDVSGYGQDQWKAAETTGLDEGRDSVIVGGREVLVNDIDTEGKGTLSTPKPTNETSPTKGNCVLELTARDDGVPPPMPPIDRRTTEETGLLRPAQLPPLPIVDDSDICGPPGHIDPDGDRPKSGFLHPLAADIQPAAITEDCMRDPLLPSFMEDVWNRAARNNTKLYRRVFRCMPDSEVTTWQQYREYRDYGIKFSASMEGRSAGDDVEAKSESPHNNDSTAAGAGISAPGPEAVLSAGTGKTSEKLSAIEQGLNVLDAADPEKRDRSFDDNSNERMSATHASVDLDRSQDQEKAAGNSSSVQPQGDTRTSVEGKEKIPSLELQTSRNTDRKTAFSKLDKPPSRETPAVPSQAQSGSVKRRRRATTRGSRRGFALDDMPSRADAEELLKMIQGNIVQFPYDWLVTEEQNGNWGYQVDGVAPLSIYN